MSTYGHHQRAALGFGGQAAVGTRHAAANTMGVILAAIVVGVLIALLIAVAIGGPAATGVHRAGAHGRVTTMHRLQASLPRHSPRRPASAHAQPTSFACARG
jgi:lipopolysaccharide/colanic/teichoic acid biosynthesis glycosyltransferase